MLRRTQMHEQCRAAGEIHEHDAENAEDETACVGASAALRRIDFLGTATEASIGGESRRLVAAVLLDVERSDLFRGEHRDCERRIAPANLQPHSSMRGRLAPAHANDVLVREDSFDARCFERRLRDRCGAEIDEAVDGDKVVFAAHGWMLARGFVPDIHPEGRRGVSKGEMTASNITNSKDRTPCRNLWQKGLCAGSPLDRQVFAV